LPVHLYGHALDLERLGAMAKKHTAVLIEDCAQSILAESRGVRAGSVGALSATSFYPTKNLGAFGDAGAVLANDAALATVCRGLRDYGQSKKYVHDQVGMNSRLDELQAAILRSALLPHLEKWTERRRAIAAAYREGIRSAQLTLPPVPAGSKSAWHLFPVLSPKDRDGFLAHLKARGIGGGVHYPILISDQKALASAPHQVLGTLEQAQRFATFEASLPIHPFMTDADVAQVIDACNAW
jgi:dTDP-3-amino-3,4,6-trideoxy-alpha-D-glucose transaminase